MKIKLLIVGKKSFIGSNIYNSLKKKYSIKIFNFKELLQKNNKEIDKFNYIINYNTNKNYIK